MADANNHPPAAAAATHLALTPAKATDDVIDYNTKQGAAIWQSGSNKLSEELFDCVPPKGLRDFLELTKKRSKLMGWDTSVMSILDDPDDVAGPAKDYLDHYSSISLENLQANAQIYADTPTRVAQDSMMLFTTLHDNGGPDAHLVISFETTSYPTMKNIGKWQGVTQIQGQRKCDDSRLSLRGSVRI